jgi:hypothetical protein
MKQYTSWVEITGKICVQDWEMADELGLVGDEERTAVEKLEDVQVGKITEAFDTIARRKVSEMFPTDEPFKLDSSFVLPLVF